VRETNNSPPSGAEIKNEWTCISTRFAFMASYLIQHGYLLLLLLYFITWGWKARASLPNVLFSLILYVYQARNKVQIIGIIL
jgi:hypothetical protein